MTIKKTAITTSLLLTMGLSVLGFAETKVEMVDADVVSIECITQADVGLMTAEDKEKLTLPVCEEVEENEDGTTPTQ